MSLPPCKRNIQLLFGKRTINPSRSPSLPYFLYGRKYIVENSCCQVYYFTRKIWYTDVMNTHGHSQPTEQGETCATHPVSRALRLLGDACTSGCSHGYLRSRTSESRLASRQDFIAGEGSLALDISPFLRGLPEPARTCADHCLTLARDVLEPGTFLSYRGERVKPALDFQVFTEAWAVEVFNVVVADRELGPSGGDRAPGQGFPTCVVQ